MPNFLLPGPEPPPSEAGGLPRLVSGWNAEIGITTQDRLDVFSTAVSPAWIFEPKDPASFDMSESVYVMGDGVVFSCHYPGMKIDRTVQCVRRADVDYYALQLRPRGEIRLEADGRRMRAAAGQILLTDFARASQSEIDEGPQLMALIPRNEFNRLLSRNLDLHGLNLHEMIGGVGVGLLASHLKALSAQLPRMGVLEAAGALQATMHLLAAALAPSIDSLGLARQAIEQSVIHQAREFVDEHLRSPQLSPDILCRHLRISRSRLYRIFEPFGGVTTYIKERRLAQIHAQLTGQSGPSGRRRLGQLADEYGFLSQSAFSRAFREQYGYTAREAQGMRFSVGASTSV